MPGENAIFLHKNERHAVLVDAPAQLPSSSARIVSPTIAQTE
jgi:hypothetical protein